MNPQLSGINPQVDESQTQGANPQETNSLQMVVSPFGGSSLSQRAQISTTMLPISMNPLYGLPNYPQNQGGLGGSDLAYPRHEP